MAEKVNRIYFAINTYPVTWDPSKSFSENNIMPKKVSLKVQKGERSRGKYQDQDSGFEKLTEMSADLLILEYLNISTPYRWDFTYNPSFNDIYYSWHKKIYPPVIFSDWFFVLFLAVQDSSIGDLVTQSVSESGLDFRNAIDNWNKYYCCQGEKYTWQNTSRH